MTADYLELVVQRLFYQQLSITRVILALASAASMGAQPLDLKDSALGLPTGSMAPLFSLADQRGRYQDFESLRRNKGLILVFFRSADWCIYCKSQIEQLERDLPLLAEAGWGLAAVSYDSADVLREFALRKKINFPLLSDRDSTVIRAFGVENREYGPRTQLDVEREVVHRDSFDNVPVHGLAYPAVFAIGSEGRVEWRFVSEGAELRLTGASILHRAAGEIASSEVPPTINRSRIAVTILSGNRSAALGNRIVVGLALRIPPGLHVYGAAVGREYRPLAWKINSSACWQVEAAAYPPAERQRFDFSQEPLPVHHGELRVFREAVLLPGIRASDASVFQHFLKTCVGADSKIRLGGILSFQACDRKQCYPPQSMPLEWKFDFLPPDRQRSPLELRREFEQPQSRP